jgi:hypothetical protein
MVIGYVALIFLLSNGSLVLQEKMVQQPVNINFLRSLKNKESHLLSKFVDKVSYIPLETSPGIVVSDNAKFEVTDDYIIVTNLPAGRPQILLFDRKTGKFIREISKQGRGPDEFSSTSYIPFNDKKNEIYALGPGRQILAYNIHGKISDRIKPPEWKDIGVPDGEEESLAYNILQSVHVQYYDILDTNIFVGYVQNRSGHEKKKIVLFSKDGFLKVFDNRLIFNYDNWKQSWHPPGQFAKFYRFKDELYFIEAFCDTLYHVTRDKLMPRYFFNLGKYNPPYSGQPDIMLNKHWGEYFFLLNICENEHYIFVNYLLRNEPFLSIIDKRNNSISTCTTGHSGKSAILDDINGFIDVIPSSVTTKNELVYIIKAQELVKLCREDPGLYSAVKDRQPWLCEINELSNPIVAVGRSRIN